MMHRFWATALILGIVITTCFADEEEEDVKKELSLDDVRDKFDNVFEDNTKGLGDFFKNAAGDVKERAESSVETMKGFGDLAKEKSEAGMEAAKGFASGIGEHFSKMKETVEEHKEKMKDAFTSAAEKSKDEFQTAASKISKHAKEASDTMFSLFQFK